MVVTGGSDWILRVWDTLPVQKSQNNGHVQAVADLAFIPGTQQCVSVSWSGDVDVDELCGSALKLRDMLRIDRRILCEY